MRTLPFALLIIAIGCVFSIVGYPIFSGIFIGTGLYIVALLIAYSTG